MKNNKINMLSINDMLLESRYRWLLPGLFFTISTLAAIDIIADIKEGTDVFHVIAEVLVFVIALSAATITAMQLVREARRTRQLMADMQQQIVSHRNAAAEWRQENHDLMQGLGASINRQFQKWQLTATEKEIAILLLKGLSHKEIALLRNVSEATARQQARSVYQKANVNGRNELAAFFLEDLALPADHDVAT